MTSDVKIGLSATQTGQMRGVAQVVSEVSM